MTEPQKPDKNTQKHTIADLNSGKAALKDGKYEYVLPTGDQASVYTRKPTNNGGHTSMLGPNAEIAYAGTLDYKQGAGLEKWDNMSGHYRPPSPKASATGFDMGKFQSVSTQQQAAAAQSAAAAKAAAGERDSVKEHMGKRSDQLSSLQQMPQKSVDRRKAREALASDIQNDLAGGGITMSKKQVQAHMEAISKESQQTAPAG